MQDFAGCQAEFLATAEGICTRRTNTLDEEGGPCFGDSGSSTGTIREGHFEIDGVVSYGNLTCDNYGVHVPVVQHIPWILANIEGDSWE